MSRDAVQFAGEFGIDELKIASPSGGVADLLSDVLVIEINIFEDIFKNAISGTITMSDIRDVITLLPIQGQEELYIKLRTPSLNSKEDTIDFTQNPFIIHKVNMRREVSSGGQIYDLSFVSPEAIKNTKKRVSKSYVKTKANIGEMVEDLMIHDRFGIKTKKDVDIEPTIGTRKYIVTNTYPFSFISKLTKEAKSKKGSPHYLFFENKKGYHFKTFQFLYQQAQKKGIRGEFHVGDIGFDEETTKDPDSGKNIQNFKRVLQYSLNSKKDMLINTTTGLFGGTVIEHNLYSKNFKTKTYNYFDDGDFDAHERISSNRLYSTTAMPSIESLQNDIETSNINVLSISKDTEDVDKTFEKGDANQRFDTLLERNSRLVEYQDGISINMTIHGQTTLTVGDMIRISIPAVGSEDEVEDKLYSGPYLITKLRHTFSPPTRSHVISMEVVKDGLNEGLPTSPISEQAKVQAKKTISNKPSDVSNELTDTSETIPDSSKGNIERKISPEILDDNAEFQSKLAEMEKKYPGQGFSKQKLYQTIKGESAFDTGAKNKNTNASGLFQLTQPALDDINQRFGENYTLGQIRDMNATQQLEVYDQYLTRWNYDGSNELGIMQGAPAFANRSSDSVVYGVNTSAYEQNPGWRPAGGGAITVASMNAYYLSQT